MGAAVKGEDVPERPHNRPGLRISKNHNEMRSKGTGPGTLTGVVPDTAEKERKSMHKEQGKSLVSKDDRR